MDGRRPSAGEDAQAGRDCAVCDDGCPPGLAQVIWHCLLGLVTGCDPARDVWQRILALIGRAGSA